MPIYEYICDECGVKEEFLQKHSDVPIAACSKCGSHNFHKCVSAAGFQLKGDGWYQSEHKQTVPACVQSGSCDGCGS